MITTVQDLDLYWQGSFTWQLTCVPYMKLRPDTRCLSRLGLRKYRNVINEAAKQQEKEGQQERCSKSSLGPPSSNNTGKA